VRFVFSLGIPSEAAIEIAEAGEKLRIVGEPTLGRRITHTCTHLYMHSGFPARPRGATVIRNGTRCSESAPDRSKWLMRNDVAGTELKAK
jgi:hypothetical protein